MNIDISYLLGKNVSEKFVVKYIKEHYPEHFDKILKLEPEKFKEKLYWYIHDLKEFPKCLTCDGPVRFKSLLQGYKTYCCSNCANKSSIKKEQIKNTNIKRYGGVAPACSKEVKNKAKQTCLKKYGKEYAIQNKDIQEKVKEFNRKKYGVDWASSLKEITDKQVATQRARYGGVGFESSDLKRKAEVTKELLYGDPYYNNNEQSVATQRARYGGVGNESAILKQKYQETRRACIIDDKDFLIGYTNEGYWICKCPHPECNKCSEKNYIIKPILFSGRLKDHTEPCTRLLPVQKSHSACTTIELFVRDILDKCKIKYETNKFMLDGKQVDIYIPSKKFAIECNGVYHHSTRFKNENYHINKFKIACNKGIRLLTIWSDQIINHPEIVKSMILTKIGKCKNSLYARKCIIKEVESAAAGKFLENNHIQGSTPTSVRLGLYYNNELVSLMTFTQKAGCQGKKDKSKTEWNLNRFCNKINTHVVGGASKLLKYFIKNYNPKTIISFSHNDISDGHLYETLGFVSDHKINSSYYYVKGLHRWHRSTFTKAGIVARGWKDKIDSSWTERQVMDERNYLRIYDSGTQKWIYTV